MNQFGTDPVKLQELYLEKEQVESEYEELFLTLEE